MGINIVIVDSDGNEHPDWDSFRYASDNDIKDLVLSLPHECRNKEPDIEYVYRPADFGAWKAAAQSRTWPNPGRFERLIELLEQNPDCWIRISY